MTEIHKLEQSILDLITVIEKLQIDINDLKKSNGELRIKLHSVNEKLDNF